MSGRNNYSLRFKTFINLLLLKIFFFTVLIPKHTDSRTAKNLIPNLEPQREPGPLNTSTSHLGCIIKRVSIPTLPTACQYLPTPLSTHPIDATVSALNRPGRSGKDPHFYGSAILFLTKPLVFQSPNP